MTDPGSCFRVLAQSSSFPSPHLHAGLYLRKLAHDGQYSIHGTPWPQV